MLFHSYRTHSHLDWHETEQWLEESGSAPILLAWQNLRLQGVLAASAPLNQASWIRLASVSDHSDTAAVLARLWNMLKPELRAQDVTLVALLIVRNWLASYAPALGFHFAEEIITFRRPELPIPDEPLPDKVTLRQAEPDDLPAIVRVDNAAFAPPWQMDFNELRQAQHIAANCTVAQIGGQIVGYQVSTLYFDGAHLARLAVSPSAQGNGVARALLSDVLRRFERRGVRSMTVNTQASNVRSQRLYTGFGFERNGYDLPVWIAEL